MILEKVGITYEIAQNGKEGVEMYFDAKQKFDLVLMDLQMPIMSGYEATKKIREVDTTIPIVALTAAAMVEDKEKATKAGMSDHVTKPIDKNELYRVISNLTTLKIDSSKTTKKAQQVLDMEYLEDTISSSDRRGALLLNLKKQLTTGEFKDIDTATKVHSLKGVSGNVGAYELCNILTIIDEKYKKNDKITQDDLANLTQAKQRLVEKIDKVDKNKEEKKTTKKLSFEKTSELLSEVKKLLKDGLKIQDHKIQTLHENLDGLVPEYELLKWLEYVNDFDFDEALEMMQGWKI
jgi:CheY-like chemotaxis protein